MMIYQDRLGTNTGEALKKGGAFSDVLFAPLALARFSAGRKASKVLVMTFAFGYSFCTEAKFATTDASLRAPPAAENTLSFCLSFSCVCPEPVLVKRSV